MTDQDTNPDRLYDAANKLKESGDLAGAVEALKTILIDAPDHVQSHLALGVHLQKLGRHDEAIEHARRVTVLQPDDAFSFTQYSVILQRCGRILEAEDAMARARMLQAQRH